MKKFDKFLLIGVMAMAGATITYENRDNIDQYAADNFNVSVFQPTVADVRIKQIENEINGVNKANKPSIFFQSSETREFINETITAEEKTKLSNRDYFHQFIQKINTPYNVYDKLTKSEREPQSFTEEKTFDNSPKFVSERIANFRSNDFAQKMDAKSEKFKEEMQAVMDTKYNFDFSDIKEPSKSKPKLKI